MSERPGRTPPPVTLADDYLDVHARAAGTYLNNGRAPNQTVPEFVLGLGSLGMTAMMEKRLELQNSPTWYWGDRTIPCATDGSSEIRRCSFFVPTGVEDEINFGGNDALRAHGVWWAKPSNAAQQLYRDGVTSRTVFWDRQALDIGAEEHLVQGHLKLFNNQYLADPIPPSLSAGVWVVYNGVRTVEPQERADFHVHFKQQL